MSSLPPGWELDYDADSSRWFYRYKPSGLTQYQFPREGDEFPDYVDNAAPIPTLAPEERLESQQQIRRKGHVDGPADNNGNGRVPAGRKRTSMSATGGPVSMTWDDDDADKMFYQPESFMYLGPGAYNDVSPVAEEEEDDAFRGRKPSTGDDKAPSTTGKPAAAAADLGSESRTTSQPVSSISTPQPSIATPARPPVDQVEPQTAPTTPPLESMVVSIEIPAEPSPPEQTPPQPPAPATASQEPQASSPNVPLLDSTERPHELPETTRFDPVGVVAEMATEDTARAHIELHPDPVEIGDNTVLAPIETFMMTDVGIAELPAHSSPTERQKAEREKPPPRRRNDQPIQRVYPFQPREDDDPNRPPTPLGPAAPSHTPSPQPSTTGLQDQPRSYTPLVPSPASTPGVTPPASVSSGHPHQGAPQPGPHGQPPTTAPQFVVTRKPTNAGKAPSKFKAWAPGAGAPTPPSDLGARQGVYPPAQRADQDDISTTGNCQTPSVLVPPAIPPKTPIDALSQGHVDQRPSIQRSFTQPPVAPEPQGHVIPPPVPRKEYDTVPATLAPARPPITGQMPSFLRQKAQEEAQQHGQPPSQVPALMAAGPGAEPRPGMQRSGTMPIRGPHDAAQYTAFNPQQGAIGPSGPRDRPFHVNDARSQAPGARDPRLQQRPHANSLPGTHSPLAPGQQHPRHGLQPYPQQLEGAPPAALQPGAPSGTIIDEKGKGKAPVDPTSQSFTHRSASHPAQEINQGPSMAPMNQQAPAPQHPGAANPRTPRPASMYSLGTVQVMSAPVPADQHPTPLQQPSLTGPQQPIAATAPQAPPATTIAATAQAPPSLRTDSTSPPDPPSGRSMPGYPLASPSPFDIRRGTPSAPSGPSSSSGPNYTPSPLTVGSSPGPIPPAQGHGQTLPGRGAPANASDGVSETRAKRMSALPPQSAQQPDSYFPPQPVVKPEGQAQSSELRRSPPTDQRTHVQGGEARTPPILDKQPLVTTGPAISQGRPHSMIQRSQSLSAGKPPVRQGIGQPFAHDSPTQLQHHQPVNPQQQTGGLPGPQQQPMVQGMLPQGTPLGHPLYPITEHSEYDGTSRSNSLASRSSSRRHSLPPAPLRQGIQRQPSIAEQPSEQPSGNTPSPPPMMPPQQHPPPLQYHPGGAHHAQPHIPMPMPMPMPPPGPYGPVNYAMRSVSGPTTPPAGQPPTDQAPTKTKSKWFSKFMKASKTLQKQQAPQWTPPPPQWPQPPGHFVQQGQGRGQLHPGGQAQNGMTQMHPQPPGMQVQNGMVQPPMHSHPQGMAPGMVYGPPQGHPSGHPLTKLIHQHQHAAASQTMAPSQRSMTPAVAPQTGSHSGSPTSPPGAVVPSQNQNGSPNAKPAATAQQQAVPQAPPPAQPSYESQVEPLQAAPAKPPGPLTSHPPALSNAPPARSTTPEKPQTSEPTRVQSPQSHAPQTGVESTDSDDVASILTMDVSTMDVSEAQMIQRMLKPQLIQVTRPTSGSSQKQVPSQDVAHTQSGEGPSGDHTTQPIVTGPGFAPPAVHVQTPSGLPGHIPPPGAVNQLQSRDSLKVAPLFTRKPLLRGEVSPPLSGRESMVSDVSSVGSAESRRVSAVSAIGAQQAAGPVGGQRAASGFRSKMATKPAVDYSGDDWGE